MPWLIFALGLVLGGAGGGAIVHGYPYMQIEFGWTEVIAGSVALSGGIVTIALAAVLHSLSAWRAATERQAASALPTGGSVGAPGHEDARRQAALALPPEEVEPAPAGAAAPEEPRRSARTDRPAADTRRAIPRWRAAAGDPAVRPDPVPAPATVVGRYQSGGSSYVLFSDGTIEVEGKGETRRFGSMDELKSFMSSEEAGAGHPAATA